jgi:hypothetical protein
VADRISSVPFPHTGNPTLPFSPFTFPDKSALELVSREIGKMDGTAAAPARENLDVHL